MNITSQTIISDEGTKLYHEYLNSMYSCYFMSYILINVNKKEYKTPNLIELSDGNKLLPDRYIAILFDKNLYEKAHLCRYTIWIAGITEKDVCLKLEQKEHERSSAFSFKVILEIHKVFEDLFLDIEDWYLPPDF